MDLALDDHLSDADYLDLLKRTLPELIQNLQPDFIFYLSGVDVLATDKLGRLGLSIEGCKLRDQFVFEQCYEAQIPVQCSMGGGYSPCLKTIVDAHTNTYRVALEYYG